MQVDLLIRGVQIADGDSSLHVGDVAIDAGRIAAVGPHLAVDGYGELVDGEGLLLCPGFIDMHAHSALQQFLDPLLTAKVAQGFQNSRHGEVFHLRTPDLGCPTGTDFEL